MPNFSVARNKTALILSCVLVSAFANSSDTGDINVPTTTLPVKSTERPKTSQAVIPDLVNPDLVKPSAGSLIESAVELSSKLDRSTTIKPVTQANVRKISSKISFSPAVRPAWKDDSFKMEKRDEEDFRVTFQDNNLTLAVEAGDTQAVKNILDLEFGSYGPARKRGRGAKTVNYWDSYPLRHASQHGYTEIVKILINHGASVRAMNSEAIRLASQGGHLEIVKLLFREGSEYQVFQDYAIRSAAVFNHTEVVDFLLAIGGDPKSYDGFALICVEDKNMVEKLKRSAFKDFTEKRIKNWEKATKFKKYGKSFCTDIDEKNLLFASSLKPSINGFLLVLFAVLVNL